MTTFTEGRHAAEFVLYEDDASYSRDNITIESGAGVIVPGTVLAQKTVGAGTAAAKSGGNTGTGTISAITVAAGAKVGVYTARCITAATNGGTFRVEDPDGYVLGDVAVGSAFADDIGFTISDGGTDFIVGDGFDITVAAGAGKWVPATATGATGAQTARAINLYGVDATSADVEVAAITRHAAVNGNILTYDASIDDDTKKAAKIADLKAVGIIVR